MQKALRSSEFVETYNKLDRYLREKYNLSNDRNFYKVLEVAADKDKYVKRHQSKLKKFGDLRNAIIHNFNGVDTIIAEPHIEVVDEFKKIEEEIECPPKAYDKLAIKNVYTASLEDSVIDIMKVMNQKVYTYIPVVSEKNNVIGVFSENTLFSYIVYNEEVILDNEHKLCDFKEFLPIEKHEAECFKFVSRKKTVLDVKEMFAKCIIEQKRLSAVFITETGKSTEKLLGIITAWDVIRN